MGGDMPDVVPPLIAGRYQLVELIGRGGMGEVWRGDDHRLDTPVAVKILDPLVGGVAAGQRFAREARAAAQIMHPNVVTVLDVGQDGSRFLVMELLSGRTLAAELVERGRFGFAEACAVLSQAAAGLHAAHRAGVVHRDVKPANLHLTAEGILKVVDFGLAHVASEASRLTTVGTIIGTAAYLAPEQIDGSGGEAPTDLYALGCVCYELLCGHPPFQGSVPELVYQHLHQPPVPPSQLRPDISVELERLILAMLAKDPATRPASAETVRQVLAAVARSTTARAGGRQADVSMPPPPLQARAGDTALLDVPAGVLPPQPSPEKPAEGRPLLLLVAVAAITVVAVGVVLFADSGDKSAAPQTSAVPSQAASQTPATTEPTPSRTAGSIARPSARPTSTPTPRPTSPGWQGWLADFDRAVLDQEGRGGIEPDLARKVHEKIRKAAEKLMEGKGGEGQDQIRKLGRDLVKAQGEGKLAGTGPLADFLRRSGLSGGSGENDD
jgi:serine/threonine protein kinase